jgi:ribose transport system substrate-binding protein
MPIRTPKVLGALLVAVACAAGAAGCGDDDAAGTDAGSPAASTATAAAGAGAFDERLTALYRGTFGEVPTDGPAAAKDKRLWIVAAGQIQGAGADATSAAAEAARKMGWDVTLVDGKFDPDRQLGAIRQAVATKADGILLYTIDCPSVQAGLQAAKDASVPVVAMESFDCDELDPDAPSLFADYGTYATGPYPEWIEQFGVDQASAVAAKTDAKAKVILFVETDLEATLRTARGFRAELRKCSGCEIVEQVDFTALDFGPRLQQKAAQAIARHPDANAVVAPYDAPVVSGIAAAVRESGRSRELFVMGGEGTLPAVELVREDNGMDMGLGIPVQWEGLAGLDALNRIFQDRPVAKNTGMGVQLWDRENNLPPEGERFQSPVDFRSAYYRMWGID